MKKAILIDSQGFIKLELVSDEPNPVISLPVKTRMGCSHRHVMADTAAPPDHRLFILQGKIGDSFVYEERIGE